MFEEVFFMCIKYSRPFSMYRILRLRTLQLSKTTTTKMICSNAPIFFKGGSKCTPLLQMEQSYYSI